MNKRVIIDGGIAKLADAPKDQEFRPIDLQAVTTGGTLPAEPIDALGSWAGIVATAATLGCSPLAYAMTAHLVCGAAAIGGHIRVRIWEGYSEPCILRAVNVGESSSRKSPALLPFLNALHIIQDDEHAAWKRDYAAWKQKQDAVKAFGGKGDGEDEPIKPYLIIQDATVEKLAVLLAARPKGMILVLDELAALLGGFGRYKGVSSGDRAFYNETFGGGRHSVHRMTRASVDVPCAALGVIGNATPDVIRKALTGDNIGSDGLAERFLYVWPEARRFEVPPFEAQQTDAKAKFAMAYRRLATLPAVFGMTLGFEAMAIYSSWRREELDPMERSSTGLWSGHLGKTGGIAARIAMVLELLEWAASSAPHPSLKISKPSMLNAITLTRWFQRHAERTFGRTNRPALDASVDTLASYLRDNKVDEFNARELRRKGLPGLRDLSAFNAACDELLTLGWISHRVHDGNFATNRRRDYVVNPLAWGFSADTGWRAHQ